jgi:hypothetical protein
MSVTVTQQTATTIATKVYYKKKLEGIQTNDKLLKCWKESIDLISGYKNIDKSSLSSVAPTLEESKEMYKKIVEGRNDDNNNNNNNNNSNCACMSMEVFRAIQMVLQKENKLAMLEEALATSKTSLVFTTPSRATKDQEQTQGQGELRFQKRMERLRLQNEETKYSKLTNNLQDHRNEDDITAKSMTFAASVGLNMIIAPLSFGCFMYFFAGGMLDYFFPTSFENSKRHNGTDIKRVIIGVVSGVIMMIIEMILFVIRTHEFEKHSTLKKKKKGVEPFGAYSSKTTPAVYTDNSRSSARTVSNKKGTTNTTSMKTQTPLTKKQE